MQNRMDKYSLDSETIGSRTERNKSLYESVKNSSMKNYEIKSNVSIIDEDADSINVVNVRKMLDERYNDTAPKRKSIELPEFDNPVVEETAQDTKEYDINAILAKAKKGKNVDYNKERLKKIRQTQFDILNNLDLEIKNIEEKSKSSSQEDAENNLRSLINTITELEIKNKKKDVSTELELLSDLTDDSDGEVTAPNKVTNSKETTEEVFEEEEEPTSEIRLVRIGEKREKAEIKEPRLSNTRNVVSIVEDANNIIKDKKGKKDPEKKDSEDQPSKNEKTIEETLTKLNIKTSSYDDFADVSKRDNGSLILKIIIFIVIIVLVLGAVYILNDILGLGLF